MSANLLKTLSVDQLRRAIALRTQIARLEAQLGRLTGETSPDAKPDGRRRRRFSAATRAKMAAAQKARWAKRKAGK